MKRETGVWKKVKVRKNVRIMDIKPGYSPLSFPALRLSFPMDNKFIFTSGI
jgi:hypothetical protein